MKQKKRHVIVATSLLCSTMLCTICSMTSISTQAAEVNVSEWQIESTSDTKIIKRYVGNAKDVVIPLSGDLRTTNVKITKTALREAAVSADKQGGTLVNSANDTSGTGLVVDNSTDNNPNDDVVDYSGTFKDLKQITKIDLSSLKMQAADGDRGADTKKSNSEDAWGRDGEPGESINVSSMFENCESLREVDLSSCEEQAGRGGIGGRGGDGYGCDGGNGYGGQGGAAGNFYAQNMFANTLQLYKIDLAYYFGISGQGGRGGNGYGGDGAYGGKGRGGDGFIGGSGYGGNGTRTDWHATTFGGDGIGGNGYGGWGGAGYGGDGFCKASGWNGYGQGGCGYGGCCYGVYYEITDMIWRRERYEIYGGYGGNGQGGLGYSEASNNAYGGKGVGGDGYSLGGTGSGGSFQKWAGNGYVGESINGKADPSLAPENLTGEVLAKYKKFTGTTIKTNMFYPIAVKERTLTQKLGFDVNQLKANVAALRTVTDSEESENDLNDTELAKVTITATNQAGTVVNLADVSKRSGKYNLTYTYGGKTAPVTLTVESALKIETRDITIGKGDTWNPKDNLDRAIDPDGNPLSIDKINVTNNVNVNQAGSYTITYEYQGVKQTAKVNVIDIQTKKIPTLDIGETFSPYAGLARVIEANGSNHTDEAWFKNNIGVKVVSKETASPIDATKFTQTAGVYTIMYTYQGVSRSVNVTVEKKELVDQSKIPTSIDFGKIPIQYQTTDEVTGKTNGQATTASIQVKDTRSESGEGYQLKVHQNQVFTGKNTNKPLNASLSFKSGTITNSEKHSISGGNQSITLTPGEDKIVLTANKGKSRGMTTMPLTDFKLSIPKESEKLKDTYQTTLTWTLFDAP